MLGVRAEKGAVTSACRPPRTLVVGGALAGVFVAALLAAVAGQPDGADTAAMGSTPALELTHRPDAATLARLSDAELGRMDPVLMNLAVARGIPEFANLDPKRYTERVDAWARTISEGLRAAEPLERGTELYRHDPDLWRVGGMAVTLAGPRAGIAYTSEPLDIGDPRQSFVNGLIDSKRGTCASMPVLYLGIAHRLGWPLKAVVSRDHMWVRWDDGREDGKRFNLEATSARSEDGVGSFSSMTDEQIAELLGTPRDDIESGSDFGSLTPRQTLAVYLQARAGYWAAKGDWRRARADVDLAHGLFPANRDIAAFRETARDRLQKAEEPVARRRESARWEAMRRDSDEREARLRALVEENQRRVYPPVQEPHPPEPAPSMTTP